MGMATKGAVSRVQKNMMVARVVRAGTVRVVVAMAVRRKGEQKGKPVAQEEVAMVARKEAQKVVAPEVPWGTEAQEAVERVEAELAKVGIGAEEAAVRALTTAAAVGRTA